MKKRFKELLASLQNFSERYRHTSLDPRTLKPRYILGIFLICLSFVVGWGIPAAAVVFALYKKKIIVSAAVAVSSYISSWGIFSVGMFFSTKQSLIYLRALGAKIIYYLINPLERITLFHLTNFFCLAGTVSSFFVFGISRFFFLTFATAFLLHQTVLICSLVVQNNCLMNRPIRGKTLNLVTDLPQNTFMLRFDDGPGLLTESLLNRLAVAQLHVFFCVTGEMARKNPQIIKRAFLEGHIIVNHTENHKKSFSLLNCKKLNHQIIETQKILYEITGAFPRFFAAPMGHGNLFLKKILKQNNLQLLGWDINARDAFSITKKTKEKLIAKINKNKAPQIILLHDSSYASFKDRESFLDLVETVISHIV